MQNKSLAKSANLMPFDVICTVHYVPVEKCWQAQPTHPVDSKLHESVGIKPVDGEIDDQIENILDDFGHDVVNNPESSRRSLQAKPKRLLKELHNAHLQAAVNNAEVQMFHRVGDVLSWHIAQGNIEMKHRNLEQIMQQLNQGEK